MRAAKTILTAGIVAGTLDLALAITFFAVQGAPLATVPHAIASGVLGVRAFSGGASTAALGVGLHYLIAFSIAAVYYLLSRTFKLLNHQPLLGGTVYGLAVFLIMQDIVLPRSAYPHSSGPTLGWLIANLASHVLFIGITIALITRRFALRSGAMRPAKAGSLVL